MVIDFSVIKDVVCSWIDEYLDHGFLVYKQDSELLEALRKLEDSKIYVMDKNPTAENIAKLLLEKANQLLTHYPVLCEQVTVQETVNCFATADIFRDEE
jgi:6-pyruvoyltetrahydropterin/6-carboxytetrahydropterin synthase